MKTTIRKATISDVEQLFLLVLESQLFQKKILEKKVLDENRFSTDTRETITQWMQEDEKAYLIVEDNGEILGFILCFIDNPVSREGTVADLYVDPSVRGKGIGTLLLNNGIAWLKDNNVHKVALAVHKDNLGALDLYSKSGFIPEDDRYQLMTRII